MTSIYTANYPPAHSPSNESNTSDLLDAFLSPSPSNSKVRFAFPPDLQSTSSSDSSSIDGDHQLSNQGQQHFQQSPMTTLVPYYAKAEQPQPPSVAYPNTNDTLDRTKRSNKMIRVPHSHNPFGSDAIHPKKKTMKKQRKRNTAAGAVSGMVVGGLTMGPAGVFVGAAAGAYATKKVCKARERRAQRKHEQDSFQRGAEQSNVHLATFA